MVKIGQNTIRKRLNEFGATPSAKLTVDEFMRIDLETEYDPPAFIKNQSEAAFQIEDSELDDKVFSSYYTVRCQNNGPLLIFVVETGYLLVF